MVSHVCARSPVSPPQSPLHIGTHDCKRVSCRITQLTSTPSHLYAVCHTFTRTQALSHTQTRTQLAVLKSQEYPEFRGRWRVYHHPAVLSEEGFTSAHSKKSFADGNVCDGKWAEFI